MLNGWIWHPSDFYQNRTGVSKGIFEFQPKSKNMPILGTYKISQAARRNLKITTVTPFVFVNKDQNGIKYKDSIYRFWCTGGGYNFGVLLFYINFSPAIGFPLQKLEGGEGVPMFAGCKNTCELQEGIRRELKTLKKSQSELFQIHNFK